jgi:hypothetical protein
MAASDMYLLPEFGPIVGLLDSILGELNAGLFIYHLEDAENAVGPESLRLVYANREAERSTGLEVGARVGKRIMDAFPPLKETTVPQTFFEVIQSQTPRRIEVNYAETGDEADYSVRAFPMPAHCVGVLFERIGESKD